MRIAAWNLNHRTKEKTISLMALCGIKSVNADILVLTEYVDGPSRLEFKRSLADMGYGHISISRRITIHNQVLIASKSEQITGDIAAPDFTDAARRLKISRPTFSRIVSSARNKVADGLVNIKAIRIEGGCCKIVKKGR